MTDVEPSLAGPDTGDARARHRAGIAERSLADEMFRLAVEACPNGMLMIGAKAEIVMANGEIERQFGYSRDALIGQPAELLFPERFSIADVLRPEAEPLEAGQNLFGQRRDGTEFPIEVGLNPIQTGEQWMVLAVIVDISERKRVERLKDEFVATVSHELRTPLTSIAGSLGLLVGQWSADMPASATRLVTIAHKNIQRLVRLINDILDIEKMESGRVVFNIIRVDLNQIAGQALEDASSLAADLGVKMRLESAAIEADVAADPDRLVQVITNLVSNALKFSPRGAEIVVAVEQRGRIIRISVRDHGLGIPQPFRPQMFEKFAQADGTNSRSKGGTGLGLSIVKQIVDRLGGQVGFDDAPGGGTIFHVDLPAWDGTAGGEIEPETGAMRPRLLFCEDDPAVAKVVRMRLRPAGFAVDFAHTPEIALSRAADRCYAAILVDLKLRDHDGIDLIARLRAQPEHRQTPILVISGDPLRGRGDVRSARLSILEWFEKPIDFARLSRMLVDATSPKPEERPRILHVDDDREVLEMVARRLDDMAEVVSADSADHARRVVESQHVDLVVLDIGLGEASGLDLLQDLRDATGNLIPVIIFSANAALVQCDDPADSTLSKTHASIDSLAAAVRDRLALLPARAA